MAQSTQKPKKEENSKIATQGEAQVARTDVQAAQAKDVQAARTNDAAMTSAPLDNGVAQVNREFQEKATLKLAKDLNLPYVNIGKTPLNPDFLKLLDFEVAEKARIIPFFRVGKKVRVAAENPNNPETAAAIKFLTNGGYDISVSVASHAGIDDALKIYAKEQKFKKLEFVEKVEEKNVGTYEKEIIILKDLPAQLEAVTAKQALNMINVGAMKTKASDIHYEPVETKVIVRLRIDGILHKAFELEYEMYQKLVNQIKYDSKMKLNVTAIPQDGRYTFVLNEKKIGVRVSSIPTPYGESIVCRFLISEEKPLTFEELGFQGLALKKLQKVCKISHGMVLATGPTGSGKTTTLYALLNKMTTPENKVITLEDPVEYHIEGVTQSQIEEKLGYTFANGLKTVLRQDPDIVMLGEVRDLETAETAAQAALTGHVVLSTLHTNSAIETIPRLVNMGLQAFMIAPALDTIIAQRLVRKVCSKCSELVPISDSAKKEFEDVVNNLKKVNPNAVFEIPEKLPKVNSCDVCSNTGYQGRIVLAEVITVSAEIKELILNNASLVDLIAAARKEGITTMREDGFSKVAQGLTTLEEVYRVTNVSG